MLVLWRLEFWFGAYTFFKNLWIPGTVYIPAPISDQLYNNRTASAIHEHQNEVLVLEATETDGWLESTNKLI